MKYPVPKTKSISLGEFVDELSNSFDTKRFGEEHFYERPLRHPTFVSPGLLLLGYPPGLKGEKILLFGKVEWKYLNDLKSKRTQKAAENISPNTITAVISLYNKQLPEIFTQELLEKGIPVIVIDTDDEQFNFVAGNITSKRLSPRTTIHGVLVDVWGVGVLILGESGIGKSECALDLVTRGHCLVADDIVEIRVDREGQLIGRSPEFLKEHMEIRGLGIVNIRDLFGPSSVRASKSVELMVELTSWERIDEFDRVGDKDTFFNILSKPIPYISVPVYPGRNVAAVVEVAARNHLLKKEGKHAAKEFIAQLQADLDEQSAVHKKKNNKDD